MKVALVHYWLVGMRGGEKVLEALCEMYPEADIYTHVVDEEKISDCIKQHRIFSTFINKLPRAKVWYQKYLPLMPMALEQLDLTDYDLVISSESGPAKGVITSPGATHICYCHTPMRYVWDMYYDYLKSSNVVMRSVMRPLIHYLKMWDFLSAARVDHFISNSAYVASRIEKFYRRKADVVHPPVANDEFNPGVNQGDFYLMVGQLVSYKRADLAVEAFNKMGKKLVIIGEGEQLPMLHEMASNNIELLGWQPFSEIQRHYSECKALIFPGQEDFGIVPLEAMASGRPVIAYGAGGALETVKNEVTGLHFSEQSVESLIEAVNKFELNSEKFIPSELVDWAATFSKERFKFEMMLLINEKLGADR